MAVPDVRIQSGRREPQQPEAGERDDKAGIREPAQRRVYRQRAAGQGAVPELHIRQERQPDQRGGQRTEPGIHVGQQKPVDPDDRSLGELHVLRLRRGHRPDGVGGHDKRRGIQLRLRRIRECDGGAGQRPGIHEHRDDHDPEQENGSVSVCSGPAGTDGGNADDDKPGQRDERRLDERPVPDAVLLEGLPDQIGGASGVYIQQLPGDLPAGDQEQRPELWGVPAGIRGLHNKPGRVLPDQARVEREIYHIRRGTRLGDVDGGG